ncbi:MAG TPA: selenocysteine-specific translation elongation factor [Streptosporangiaceae bacterium]|nr:selenocysteine-specific translation elongation factor [Streptosporangiaceae bacterium]
MQVIATAGHVDHGKSALLRALTGMEPDRWAEERRRGMTIDLGYAWMRLPSGERIAFVDVPGHARFVPNMLAGVGPVPAVLFVVAADGGWMPQSAEHLAAIDALGICRGLLAVTRADLADPGPALARAGAVIARSSLGEVPAVAVSAVTGAGLDDLVAALGALAASLPGPDRQAPVRIWVDRAFSITGSGTVVTGTLPAGTVGRGDELLVTPGLRPARVRGLQSLGENVAELSGVARAALNLRGVDRADLARGMALVRPGRWTLTSAVDVRTSGARLPRMVTVHIGSARTPATVRMFGARLARLTLRDPLPLHVADRLLLRDPGDAGTHGSGGRAADSGTTAEVEPAGWPGLFGAVVLDVRPPPLNRRGAAAAAAAELSSWPDRPTAAHLVTRHKLLRVADLAAMGLDDTQAQVALPGVAAGWTADPDHWASLGAALTRAVTRHAAENPLAPGMSADAARTALGLPDRRLLAALVAPPLTLAAGVITAGLAGGLPAGLPEALAKPVADVLADLAASPFSAPQASRLAELGLDSRGLAAAARHGALLRLADQIVLAPGAAERAGRILAGLPQPFTAAQARAVLNTTRRTLIPLLRYLDQARITRRLADDRREIRQP